MGTMMPNKNARRRGPFRAPLGCRVVFTPPVLEGNLPAFCGQRVVSCLCLCIGDFVPDILFGAA